jgi:hypothetical protein
METISYQKEVKANKDHRCNFCGEKIRKDETYLTSTHKQDGSVYDWKTHKHCSEIANRLNMYEDCDEGLTEDGFQETIHCVHDDLLITLIPNEDRDKYTQIIQQLRYVQFRQKLSFVIRHYASIDKTKNQ